MKTTNHFLVAGAALGLLASAGQANAQYQAVGDDGIAASPKVRQMLNERRARTSSIAVAPQVATYQGGTSDNVAASPKVEQMRREQKAVVAAPRSTLNVAGYRATGDDGITASPKVRTMLDERRQAVEIAPLK